MYGTGLGFGIVSGLFSSLWIYYTEFKFLTR